MNKLMIGIVMMNMIMISGCTKHFEEINTNQTKLTTIGITELPYLFSKAQAAVSSSNFTYQSSNTHTGNLFCQYFAVSATFFPSDRYLLTQPRMSGNWTVVYTEVVPQLKTIFEITDTSSPEYALASIMWVHTFHRLTDYWGPIPYFKAGEPLISVDYDSQEAIYNDFFKRLSDAVVVLRNNPTAVPYGNFDLVYAGNVSKWIKYANTLRLRLALRISKVNPSKARAEAEAAVAGGVLTDNADNASVIKTLNANDNNGLSQVSLFNEIRMSASMESVLKGYNDPRIGAYFQRVTDTTFGNTFEGIRNGLIPVQQNLPRNIPDRVSNMGTRWAVRSSGAWVGQFAAPEIILVSAEAYFLRAEGALNGWQMGRTAQVLYDSGIQRSMTQWGVTDQAAIDNYKVSTAVPVAPGDFLNSPPMNDYPIRFSGDALMQRKQIAQQKWIALYPDGREGWADLRRSNYPQIYPIVNSDYPQLPPGSLIRRLVFLDLEKQTNGSAVTAALPLLNGPDLHSTPLWWDVD